MRLAGNLTADDWFDDLQWWQNIMKHLCKQQTRKYADATNVGGMKKPKYWIPVLQFDLTNWGSTAKSLVTWEMTKLHWRCGPDSVVRPRMRSRWYWALPSLTTLVAQETRIKPKFWSNLELLMAALATVWISSSLAKESESVQTQGVGPNPTLLDEQCHRFGATRLLLWYKT